MSNAIRGMLYLWSSDDELLDKSWYASFDHRQKIIEFWFEHYTNVIMGCSISIRPKTDEDDLLGVASNGIPVKKQPSLQKKEIIHPKQTAFERPKATYDNKKSLYDIDYDEN